MKATVFLVLGCALLPSLAAGTDIYRCDDPQGVPRFQQTPCAGGEVVQLQPLAGRWEPLREGERRLWEQSRRPPSSAAGRRSVPKRKERASARSCLRKRQRVEAISARMRHGYKPAQGDRLRRRRAELEAFLRRFCD